MGLRDEIGQTLVRFRVNDSIHQQLVQAAKNRGVSLTAEIAHRLEQSLAVDRVIGGSIIDDRQLMAIVKMIALAMNKAGPFSAFAETQSPSDIERWRHMPFAFDQAVQAANRVLEAFRPVGKIENPPLAKGQTFIADLGRGFADGVLEEVARGASRTSWDIGKIALIAEELGDLLERIKPMAVGPQTTSSEVWGTQNRTKRKRK